MGLEPDRVMRLTVREMTAYAKGHKRRSDMDYRRAMWTAWHTGYFHRVKKMPDLDKLLRKIGAVQRKVMTADQMLVKAEQMLAMFGGVDLRKKKD